VNQLPVLTNKDDEYLLYILKLFSDMLYTTSTG